MRSHFLARRGFALACAVASALGVEQNANGAAFDSPAHPVYDDGWQAGDNGGFGLGPWNMTGTYTTPIQHTLDTTSIHDQIRVTPVNPGAARAWTIYNADAPPGPGVGVDISQAGRAILGGLQVGETLSVTIDNPTERQFFRGYTVRFNTGGGNTVYAGTPVSRMAVGTFEYFTNGKWYATGTGGNPTLFDTDTNAGMTIDLTLNTIDTFTLVMTPLDNPGSAYSKSGTLTGAAGSVIDWIEFELYNTDSDFHPTPATSPGETDFYISRIQIVPEPSAAFMIFAASGLMLRRRRGQAKSPHPGTG